MDTEHIAPDVKAAGDSEKPRMEYAEIYISNMAEELGVRGLTIIVKSGVTPTAAYDPATHTMLVNPDFAFPADYKDNYSGGQDVYESKDEGYRVARGAVIHECAHSLYSKFSLPDIAKLDANVGQVIMTLEELRIEWNMVNRLSARREHHERVTDLVYGAHYIAKHNIPEGAISPVEASTLLALTYGRLDAGVLGYSAGMAYRDAFEHHMSPDLIDALRALWVRYMGLTDRDMETRIEIAKEWLDLFDADTSNDDGTPGEDGQSVEGAAGEEGEEGEEGAAGEEGEGEEGEGEGEGKSGSGNSLSDDVKAAAEYAYEITRADIALDKRSKDEAARRAAREGAAKAREKRLDVAERTHKSHGMSSGASCYGTPLFGVPTKPTSAEQQGMIALARQLDKVSYVDKHKTKVGAEIPPGKLSGRGMVQSGAQRAQGRLVTAKPWKATKRRSVPKTPLTVGIIADVSGSMSSSVRSVSTAAWMLSEAVNRVQGRTSTVLMGDTAYGLIAPGQRQHEIPRYNAVFGFENVTDAFDAIDGSLNLTMGKGARILFMVTDGHFVSGPHNDYAHRAMRECKAAGVQVFWLDYDGYSDSRSYRYPDYGYGEVINMSGMSEQEQANVIGKTVIRAFDKVKAT